MKIPNKQELQQSAFRHSSDIEFKSFTSQKESFRKNIKTNHEN